VIQELEILNLSLQAGDHNLSGGVILFVSTCCAWPDETCTFASTVIQHMDSECYDTELYKSVLQELTCTRGLIIVCAQLYMSKFVTRRYCSQSGALLACGIVNCGVRNECDPALALLSDYVLHSSNVMRIGAIVG